MQPCKPIMYGDTTICDVCGLTWDTNDPSPPSCKIEDKHIDFELRTINNIQTPSTGALSYAIVFKTQKERTDFINKRLKNV